MLDRLTREAPAARLPAPFRFRDAAGRTLAVELVELREGPPSPQLEQFTLRFRGPGDRAMAQGTNRVEHDLTGPFDLFIVPSGRDREGRHRYYEAVFNRLLEPGA